MLNLRVEIPVKGRVSAFIFVSQCIEQCLAAGKPVPSLATNLETLRNNAKRISSKIIFSNLSES